MLYQAKVHCGDYKRNLITSGETPEAALETIYKYVSENVQVDGIDNPIPREAIEIKSMKKLERTEVVIS